MQYKSIKKEEWDQFLEKLITSHIVYANVADEFGQDYELLKTAHIPVISYNKPKPATSLKSFFLPVRENVTSEISTGRKRVIIGAPNCDIEGLSILDEIYLDKDFEDPFYRTRRENTLLISSDCFGTQEHCHCLTYGIRPYSLSRSDLAVISMDGTIIFRVISEKGEEFLNMMPGAGLLNDTNIIKDIENKQKETESMLTNANKGLPDYSRTGKIVAEAKHDVWVKYSARCVSCGACATICPTCTCFLLIDKPGFEKVKQLDACQYPGFERTAGGEDSLHRLHDRFRNRYMCKYVWKPQKFNSIACTGCGRCIEACIGKINKNELFREFA
ncbi:MAG: 4Fe-4S dicluster domain-containing protein [Bacteroidota bacterium]